MAKYKRYPLPIEAWKNFKLKQESMNQTFFELTGKKRNIPMTRILLEISRRPLFFENDKIKTFGKRGRRRYE